MIFTKNWCDFWIPAFAGMTNKAEMTNRVEMTRVI